MANRMLFCAAGVRVGREADHENTARRLALCDRLVSRGLARRPHRIPVNGAAGGNLAPDDGEEEEEEAELAFGGGYVSPRGQRGKLLRIRKRKRVSGIAGGETDPPVNKMNEPADVDGEELLDPWMLSRREAIGAISAVSVLAFISIAMQRAQSLRRYSLKFLFGSLTKRIPPPDVSLAKFAAEGATGGPTAALSDLVWVNVSETPNLKDKIVILSFWRASDVNTRNALRVIDSSLGKVGVAAGRGSVEFLSVHAPKFDYELSPRVVHDASQTIGISHPSAVDASLTCWRSVGAFDWPTLLVLSPNNHRVLFALPGDSLSRVGKCAAAALTLYPQLDTSKANYKLEPIARFEEEHNPNSPLSSPAKIAIDVKGGRLFIADSGNNRILILTLDGRYLDQIGGRPYKRPAAIDSRPGHPPAENPQVSPESTTASTAPPTAALLLSSKSAGIEDGPFEDALLRNPQGIEYDKNKNELVIADSGNNLVRIASLQERRVRSVVLGKFDPSPIGSKPSVRKERPMQAPWDVALLSGSYYTVTAGSNQIWKMDPSGAMRPFSGGRKAARQVEEDGDGLKFTKYSQPTGICANGGFLYVADSDSSSVRQVDLGQRAVRTVVAGDGLFDRQLPSGDKDGYGPAVRLQRPMGVCPAEDDKILVCDCYNHRVKIITPSQDECRTLTGDGLPGYRDGPREVARFNGPTGVCFDPKLRKAFVADQGNDQIRIVDSASGNVSTLRLTNMPPSRLEAGLL